MIAARISVLAALGSSALLFGCTTDGAPNALASGEAASATESVVAAALPARLLSRRLNAGTCARDPAAVGILGLEPPARFALYRRQCKSGSPRR